MSAVNSPLDQPQRIAPVLGEDGRTFANYWFHWLLVLVTKLNAIFIGSVGKATLVAGVVVVPITGLKETDIPILSLGKGIGTLGDLYQGVCTANTLTITALKSDLTTVATDVSVINYVIYTTA